MAGVTAARGRGIRHYLPTLYLLVAMLAAVIILPSALRPPPDPANTSGAINPNAPPNQNPNQILQSLQQAGGGGAGSVAGGTTTTVPAPGSKVAAPPTTTPVASLDFCYGNPPRQIPSVYAGPCVGAWHGDNRGATWTNVFPNEVRIGIENGGSPDAGPVPPASSDNASTDSQTIMWQALQQYFNEHYQFYGRKVVFYGLPDPASTGTAADYAASATQAADQYHLFAIADAFVGVCEDFVQRGLVAICDPVPHGDYLAYRPGLFSQYMDLDQAFGFGAEFACKTLMGRLTKFGGPDVNGKPRKYGFLGWHSIRGGEPADRFATDFKSECGGQIETATLNGFTDPQGAAAAITRFKTDGITTIIFSNEGTNVLLAMQQANNLAYTPEWVMIGEYADDNNLIGGLFPKQQSAHLFGFSTSVEWPQVNASTECYEAFHTVDPTGSPDLTTCENFWITTVLLMNALQGAGPHLTPSTFQQALFDVGHRFGQTAWSVGGGFGPDDYSYADDVGELWWNSAAIDPQTGSPGAYMWMDNKRFQRGQLPVGDAGFFSAGAATAPES